MKRSNRLILLIGVFLAVVAFVGIVFIIGSGTGGGGGGTPTPPTTVSVVTAARDIPLGNQIVSADLATTTIKTTDEPADAFTDKALVLGQIVRTTVTQGQILTRSQFLTTTNANSIVPSLQKGFRAIAVQVDQVTGVGTVIQTGDRVDVVLGIRIQTLVPAPGPSALPQPYPGGPQLSVKTVLQNLQVVGTLLPPATQSQQQQQAQPSPSPSGGNATTGPTVTLNGQQEIVILAVTPQQAEVIRYAQLGAEPITLTLRSTADKDSPPDATTGIVLKTLIDQYGVIPPFPIISSVPK